MQNNKTVQIDDEMLQKVIDSAYQTHLQYATKTAKTIWQNYVVSLRKREFQQVEILRKAIEECANDSLQELCSALEEIDPRASLELLLGEFNNRLNEYILPKGCLLYTSPSPRD